MIINLTQGTNEWLIWRRSGIGSSDASVMIRYILRDAYLKEEDLSSICDCDLTYIKTPFMFFLEKKNLILSTSSDYVNDYMVIGKEVEGRARELFNNTFRRQMTPTCFQNDTYSFIRTSTDGFDKNFNEVLEVKTVSPQKFERIFNEDKIPVNYYFQILHHFLATNARKVYLLVVTQDLERYLIKEYSIEEQRIQDGCDYLFNYEKKFYETYLADDYQEDGNYYFPDFFDEDIKTLKKIDDDILLKLTSSDLHHLKSTDVKDIILYTVKKFKAKFCLRFCNFLFFLYPKKPTLRVDYLNDFDEVINNFNFFIKDERIDTTIMLNYLLI